MLIYVRVGGGTGGPCIIGGPNWALAPFLAGHTTLLLPETLKPHRAERWPAKAVRHTRCSRNLEGSLSTTTLRKPSPHPDSLPKSLEANCLRGESKNTGRYLKTPLYRLCLETLENL
ncbi:hypothetical protein V1477_019305 [Vespula maculifrons]|uniref:Uncharacterized protein n=1 Tax=Vespula maculifrons TaxID=7453 RepID=A0ABD2AS47_VESMC